MEILDRLLDDLGSWRITVIAFIVIGFKIWTMALKTWRERAVIEKFKDGEWMPKDVRLTHQIPTKDAPPQTEET